MKAIPALDLRDGACVQLVGGSYDAEAVRISDPLSVALRWEDAGFTDLHIVDLDAATGRGSNTTVVDTIVRQSRLRCQVGGGLRDEKDLTRLADLGVDRMVVGTRALLDRDWLVEMTTLFPNRVVLAADSMERRVVTHGWQAHTGDLVTDVVASVSSLSLAGILVTAVHREGRMAGPDLELMSDVIASTSLPVQASGGIASQADLDALHTRGVSAAVLGMALYKGALDARVIARRFTQ